MNAHLTPQMTCPTTLHLRWKLEQATNQRTSPRTISRQVSYVNEFTFKPGHRARRCVRAEALLQRADYLQIRVMFDLPHRIQ